MRVTIEDVAREAGVSIATVSRFMNGRHGYMSVRTRERLREVVDRLGYVPNSAAQTLKTGKTRMLGVVLANIAHPYWGMVLAGIEETSQAHGYNVVIGSASDRVDLANRYLGLFLNQQVDGLLLNPARADAATIAKWSRLTCPVVTLDRTLPGLPFDLVAMDNLRGARLAVEHLLSLGHRRIGMLAREPGTLSNWQERLQGYRDALSDAGVEPHPGDIRYARESWQDGVRKTVALFRRKDRPTAVFAGSSVLNLQVLAGLKQLGLRVPEDVSVVGYDESPWDALLEPPLTTVATPARRLGVAAAEHLCRIIGDGHGPEPVAVRLEPHLVVRASTDAV